MESEVKTVTVDVADAFAIKSDTGELCRLCANTDNQLMPIFRGEGLEHSIATKIEKYLPIINVTELDKLPLQICYQCASTLIAWNNLYEGCRVADKRLREILCIDDKLYPEDETFEDYVDDYRDNYDEQTHNIPTPTPSTSNLESNILRPDATDITQLNDAKTFNETELDSTDERYTVRGTRKRGLLLSTKKTSGSGGWEERAKMVKSKKIRVTGPSSGTPRSDKFKCITCGVAFTNTNDLNSHRDTVHQVLYEDTPRKSLRIKERVAKKAKKGSTTASDVEIDECSGDKDDKTSANDGADEMYPDEQTFTCEHCGYTVKTKYSLTKHMRKNHLSEEARRRLLARPVLSCATCLKTFTHKTNLRKHVFNQHFSHLNKRETIWKRGYCCDVCGIGFGGQSDMLAHRQIVHEEEAPITWSSFCACPAKLKRCEKCSKYFRDGKQFAKHECLEEDTDAMMARIEEILKSAPSYKCDECSLCFHWKWMYRAHRENVHSKAKPLDWEEVAKTEVLFWCSLCFKAFDDDEMLEEHRPGCVVNREVKVQSFMCRFCDSSYCRKADYKRHLKIKHSNLEELDIEEDIIFRKKSMIKCPYCEFESNTKNTILNHIKVVHKIETETPFVCVPCNKVFKRKATMDTHNQIYHPKEENVDETNKILKEAEFLLNGDVAYHCTFCNRNILNAVRFVAHYRLHNLERKFTCDQCGKQTRTQHQLNAHIKIIHLNIRNFECDICGKSFHAKQSCEEHRRIHTGERPFSCEICGKTFIALNALFTHKKFHNDFYAHPCSMCPKKFKVRRSLINHIRTHTGERPFKCEICSKTFNNSSRFSYHKKVTHSDNRPFTCTQCGSCFKANKFLMRHMKLHKIRKNIQFRRRNNPAYFENHDSNPKKATSKCKSSKSESSDVLELEKSDVQTTTITFHKLYDVENVVCKETESVMESVENSLDEKTHFLAEAFDENIVQMEYTESSESGRSVKHVACL